MELLVIMRIKRLIILSVLTSLLAITSYGSPEPKETPDYWQYHSQINTAEELIAASNFQEALHQYQQVFNTYDFVFLRDYKIAAQLAAFTKQYDVAFELIRKAIAAGWDLGSAQSEKHLSELQQKPEWELLEKAYPELQRSSLAHIDDSLRGEVRTMYKLDQHLALGAMLRIRNKAQEKYALNKFAPNSEFQMKRLISMLENEGYPSEQLIGNSYWMTTILSHHNSITQEYTQRDTLYKHIKPALVDAIGKGQMSPYEFALVDDWYIAVSSDRTQTGYGFLNEPSQSTLAETNALRKAIGLRSVELRNKLVAVQQEIGMNFYLPSWVDGEIQITPN